MKKIVLIGLLILISLNSYAKSPVWKIESNGHITYLSGTIHLLRAKDYPLPKAFNKAYKQSSIIVFETDLQALKTPEMSNKLMQSVRLPKDKVLFQYLTPETQQKLQQYALQKHINLESLSTFKPAFVALTLALGELRNMGVSQLGVDEYFNQQAINDHKKILGLETPEQQIQFLSTMGSGYENEFIVQTLSDISEMHQQFSDMIASWKQGDLNKIESYFITPTKEQFPIMHQQLLVKRNKAWLPQIKHYLSTPETEMVMVGSAYLAGKDGLLSSLSNMGYKITQLH